MGHEFSEHQVGSEREPSVGSESELAPIRLPTHWIVPPEPHSTGPNFGKAWTYMPRWLQVILLLAVIVGGMLSAQFRTLQDVR